MQQLANQLLFLAVGKAVYRLSVSWTEIAAILLTSIAVEHALIYLRDRKISAFSAAALSSGFNLAFMLGATRFEAYAVGLALGLGQKHFFKTFAGKHFLNPSNVAIVAAMLLFPGATFATLPDWGQTGWFALLIAVLGGLVLLRIGLATLPLVFLAVYLAASFALDTHNVNALALQLQSAGFLMFAFFMVTDPKTLPASRPYILLHGAVTALAVVGLQAVVGEKEVVPFLALAASECLVPLWRRLEAGVASRRWLVTAAAGALVAVAALYVSPYNRYRNVEQAFVSMSPAELPVSAPAAAAVPESPRAVTRAVTPGAPDEELYPARWSHAHIVRRPFMPQGERRPHFAVVDGAIAPAPSAITAGDLGDETRLYAAMGAGDLDHDGDLDLVLAKVREPLRVLLNDGAGRFGDAGAHFFEGRLPRDVEQLALADMNGDSYLDLIVVESAYYSTQAGRIYLFQPRERVFRDSGFVFGRGKHSCGGISAADVNGDGVLDFFVSYGVNWRSESIDYQLDSDASVFYLSGGGSWRDATADFGTLIAGHGYAGMTPLFTDINGDGVLDFLLGNDFSDPSFVFLGGPGGRFKLAPKELLESNTRNSMSFYFADFDGDGAGELWENGISERVTPGRLALEKEFPQGSQTLLSQELRELERQKELGKFDCAGFTHPFMPALCSDQLLQQSALMANDESRCEGIQAVSVRIVCHRMIRQFKETGKMRDPTSYKYDVERFPKQLRENVLLKYDANRRRFAQAIAGNEDALYTGVSWAAFPYDVDADGRLDLYVTNGMVQRSHDENRLLMNVSGEAGIRFENRAAAWGAALEEDSRGVVIADFDGDGDGDLAVNNYLAGAAYLENLAGGDMISVELRCRGGNYYCLGAVVRLEAGGVRQMRSITLGGIWNSSPPFRADFGVPGREASARLAVTWPDGGQSIYERLQPGARYVVFQ